MRLKEKMMKLVNLTVVITLFLSTLNVSSMNTPLSFFKTPEPKIFRGSDATQPVFEEDRFIMGRVETSSSNKILP